MSELSGQVGVARGVQAEERSWVVRGLPGQAVFALFSAGF